MARATTFETPTSPSSAAALIARDAASCERVLDLRHQHVDEEGRQKMVRAKAKECKLERRRRSEQRKKKSPPFYVIFRDTRLNEIRTIVQRRHGGLPDTDDRCIYLEAAAYHISSRDDRAFALENWARKCGGAIPPPEEIDAVVRRAWLSHAAADELAKMLRLTYAERTALGITTIRAIDALDKKELTCRRKLKARERDRLRRRRNGVKTREEYLAANSISRTKPWVAEGISRRTWYRRQKSAGVAQVPAQHSSLTAARGLVPRAVRGRGCALAGGPSCGEREDRETRRSTSPNGFVGQAAQAAACRVDMPTALQPCGAPQ